jgi:hypothetical protein
MSEASVSIGGNYKARISVAPNTTLQQIYPTDQEVANACLAGLQATSIKVITVTVGGSTAPAGS